MARTLAPDLCDAIGHLVIMNVCVRCAEVVETIVTVPRSPDSETEGDTR